MELPNKFILNGYLRMLLISVLMKEPSNNSNVSNFAIFVVLTGIICINNSTWQSCVYDESLM